MGFKNILCEINMVKYLLALFLPSLSVLASNCAQDLHLQEGFFRLPMPGQAMTAGFFKAYNPGASDCQLVSASMPMAKKVELHTHIRENGLLKMREVPSIDLPQQQTVHFKKGGLHLMVMGLLQEIKVGDHLDLTLRFSDGSSYEGQWPVKDMMAMHHH